MLYPNLTEYTLAIDIETKEFQELSKFGPGSHRHYLEGEDSYILGVAISDSKDNYYFPPSKETFDWLQIIQENHLWVGHNVLYDLSWLYYEGFKPEKVCDTMGLVKLLAEDRQPRKGFPKPYSLDTCAYDFLGLRKNEKEITDWCEKEGLKGSPQKWLWKMPFELVAKYAKIDTRITYDLYQKLLPEIEKQGLSTIWQIEMDLLPILAETHHRGIRVDNERRINVSEDLGLEIKKLKKWLVDKAGGDFNTGSGKQLAPIFDKLGLAYKINEPTTKMKEAGKTGNPSFKGEDLLPYGIDPDMKYFPHVLVTHNKLQKLKRDFVDRLDDFMVCGRVHPMVNPYGTKTGRPACNTPNIFQIPKRGRGKKICRTLFIPEEGEEWISMDYASEEYRVFAHYAVGQGSDRYRMKYNTEDGYDMHIENKDTVNLSLGQKLCDRPKAKTIGLGVLFGMGDRKLASNLGLGVELGQKVVEKFHEVNPSFKATSRLVENRAKSRGYIFTMLGRRRRLDRDSAYRGLNFLTQGNSADLAKLSIVLAKKAGLLDKISFRIWLYDEYDFSVKPENRKYAKEFKKIGETAIKFKVRMELDIESGPNWGGTK